jgi:hypothetical protein
MEEIGALEKLVLTYHSKRHHTAKVQGSTYSTKI